MNNLDYQYAGFFSAATVSVMHFEDLLIALVLGFVGGIGGWLFKVLKEFIQKKRGAR